MSGFYLEADGIYRLRVPFDAVYTSVFLVKTEQGVALVDCATTVKDVEEYIIPSLRNIGYELSDVRFLVLTHEHEDHSGGMERILYSAPNIEVVREVRELFDKVCTYPMEGHTESCIGILDLRSNTLISGDGLQGAGVDKYRCYTKNREAYLQTIERIKNDKRIENILFSHEYEPWYSDRAFGRQMVDACLSECKKYV